MTETPGLVVHESLMASLSKPEDILEFTRRFLGGDCGDLNDEDEVLGFLRCALQGQIRHGFYNTEELGRVHVVGNNAQLYVMSDAVYAETMQDSICSVNTCTCTKNSKE